MYEQDEDDHVLNKMISSYFHVTLPDRSSLSGFVSHLDVYV